MFVGVVCRLVGCPPFWHRKQLIMVRMIMEGKYSFASPEWDDVSENAKDLVRLQQLKLIPGLCCRLTFVLTGPMVKCCEG